jgi:hypothetical protein
MSLANHSALVSVERAFDRAGLALFLGLSAVVAIALAGVAI